MEKKFHFKSNYFRLGRKFYFPRWGIKVGAAVFGARVYWRGAAKRWEDCIVSEVDMSFLICVNSAFSMLVYLRGNKDLPMVQLQVIIPKGYMRVEGYVDKEFLQFCRSLRPEEWHWVSVPFTSFSLKATFGDTGVKVEIKKGNELLYTNLLCLCAGQFEPQFNLVKRFYKEKGFGMPTRPTVDTWIHSLPVGERMLEVTEIWVCQKLTLAVFNIFYGLQKKAAGKWN